MKSFNPSYTRRWTMTQKDNEFTFNPINLTQHLQRQDGRSIEKKLNTPCFAKERIQDSYHKSKRVENLNASLERPFERRDSTDLTKEIRKSMDFGRRYASSKEKRTRFLLEDQITESAAKLKKNYANEPLQSASV